MTDITQGKGNELITVSELADYLRVSPLWIYNRVKSEEIPYLRLGRTLRFRRSAIDVWLEKMEVRNDEE